MAALVYRPSYEIKLAKDEDSLVISRWQDPYTSNPETPRYEVVDLEPEYYSHTEEASLSTGGSISVPVENFLSHFHVRRATVISPSEVRDYLYFYPELMELIKYVVGSVWDQFGSGIQLSLEMYKDQESQYERLTMYVRQYIYNENLMETIKKIRKDYHQMFPEIRGRFLLTTDFHVPR